MFRLPQSFTVCLGFIALLGAAACTSSDTPSRPKDTAPAAADPASGDTTAADTAGGPAAAGADPGQPADSAASGDDDEHGGKEISEPPEKGGKNFAAELELLYDLAACGADEAPDQVSKRFYKAHCRSLEREIERYHRRWYDRALPKLAEIVPDDVPDVVVYPFGGGDLLTALATFPDAREYTTMSLELAGDATLPEKISQAELQSKLSHTRKFARYLLQVVHSKTSNMRQIMRSTLPAQLVFGLIGMKINGYEPLALRYFTLEKDGSMRYYGAEEIEAARKDARGKDELAKLFANAEIEFRKRGDEDAPIKVWRHFGANLDDKHLANESTIGPALLAHLKKKGRITAMTKAASYLLWWRNFSTIRQYLLDNMVWMISDSTGIMPSVAKEAGFEQIPYGRFAKPFLDAGTQGTREFRELYKSDKRKPLNIRYGYPDGSPKKHDHLIVTRKKTE